MPPTRLIPRTLEPTPPQPRTARTLPAWGPTRPDIPDDTLGDYFNADLEAIRRSRQAMNDRTRRVYRALEDLWNDDMIGYAPSGPVRRLGTSPAWQRDYFLNFDPYADETDIDGMPYRERGA